MLVDPAEDFFKAKIESRQEKFSTHGIANPDHFKISVRSKYLGLLTSDIAEPTELPSVFDHEIEFVTRLGKRLSGGEELDGDIGSDCDLAGFLSLAVFRDATRSEERDFGDEDRAAEDHSETHESPPKMFGSRKIVNRSRKFSLNHASRQALHELLDDPPIEELERRFEIRKP